MMLVIELSSHLFLMLHIRKASMGLVIFAKSVCHASIHQLNKQDMRQNVHSSCKILLVLFHSMSIVLMFITQNAFGISTFCTTPMWLS